MWTSTSLPASSELFADVRIYLVVVVRYTYTINRPSHLVVFQSRELPLFVLTCKVCGVAFRAGTALRYSSISQAGHVAQWNRSSIIP